MNVKLNKEQKIRILNSDDMYLVMQQILLRQNKIRRNQEYFWVAGLDKKDNLQFVELLAIGSESQVFVEVPEIFRIAIYKLASKIILVHNHPSEKIAAPSQEDLKVTERILKAGTFVNVEVYDHLIITETKYFSMAASGDIDRFKKSKNYEMIADLEQQMKELQEQAEVRGTIKGKRQAKIEFAKRLIKFGNLSKIDIQKLSGLSPKEFELVVTGEL